MATRQSTEQLRSALLEAKKESKELLVVFDDINKRISSSAKTLKGQRSLIKKEDAQSIKELNLALQNAEKLAQQRQKTDQARLKTEQELKKTEVQRAKALIEQEKVKQSQLRSEAQLNREKERSTKVSERQRKAEERLKNAYVQLSSKTNEAQANFKRLAAEYGVNSRQARRAKKDFDRLDIALRKINDAARDGRRDVGRYRIALSNTSLGARNLISTFGLVTGGAFVLGAAIRKVFNVFTGFEKANSELKAVLQATDDEMNVLKDTSKELGSITAFTARQVTSLQTEFAKLGFNVDEIQNLTESTLDAAAALGSDLGEQAKLTGATLKAFKLDATEAKRVNDVLAVSAVKSALDFEKLNNSISTVAPVAQQFGFSIEATIALLGELSNAGFDASSGATATRNILLNLADANGKLARKLKEPVKDIPSLLRGLKQLKEEGLDLAEALEITDKRSVAAFATFLEGTDSVEKLNSELEELNITAKDIAETKLDNVIGDVTKLESAFEGLILKVEEGEGALANFSRNVIQFLTRAINSVDIFAVKTSVLFNGLKSLSQDDFKLFLDLGILENGEKLNKTIDKTIGNIDELQKEFLKLDGVTSFGGITRFNKDLLDLQRNKFFENIRTSLSDSFIKAGETAEDARILADKYVITLRNTLKTEKELKEIKDKSTIDAEKESENEVNKEYLTRAEILEEIKRIQKEIRAEKQKELLLQEPKKIQDLNRELVRYNELLYGKPSKKKEEEKRQDNRLELLEKIKETQNELNEELEKSFELQSPERINELNNRLEKYNNLLFEQKEIHGLTGEEIQEQLEVLKSNLEIEEKLKKLEETRLKQVIERTKKELEFVEKGTEAELELRKKLADAQSDLANLNDIKKEAIKIKDVYSSLERDITTIINRLADKRQKALSDQLADSVREQEKLNNAILAGSKFAEKSLAAEELRQEKIRQKQQQLEERRLKYEAATAAFNLAASTGSVSGAITGVTSIYNAIDGLQPFFHGTDNTGEKGELRDKHGVITGYTHANEMVMNSPQVNEMKKHGVTKRDEVIELVKIGKAATNKDVAHSPVYINENGEVLRGILNKLDKLTPTKYNYKIDNSGYVKGVVEGRDKIETMRRRANGIWR